MLEYTPQSGDNAARLDYNGTGALQGIIEDGAGNRATSLTLAPPGEPGSIGHSSRIKIDGDRPGVDSVMSPTANGTYGIGDSIRIEARFDENVVVAKTGGTPRIKIETGSTDRYAAYDAAASTAADILAFTYGVEEGDVSADLDYHTDRMIDLNGGTIKDEAGNNARTILPAPGTDGLLDGQASRLAVDGVRPAVDSVSSPDDDGTYGIGAAINVTVRFAEDVAVDTAGGTPYLELETGETDRRAGYVSGSPGRDLLFRYTVAENDTAADLDYSGASALALNGGSITDDPAGNAATAASLSLSGLSGQDTLAGSEDLAVDGVRPAVDSVSSPDDDGTYGIGAAINVTVTLDGDVAVDTAGGTPYLELETGETDRRAGYVSASGRDLLFRYTVAENDTAADLDYSGASALALNGGSITDDPAGNAATAASLSLSGLSGQDTLAGSEDLAVDGVRPAVDSVSSPDDDGTYASARRSTSPSGSPKTWRSTRRAGRRT